NAYPVRWMRLRGQAGPCENTYSWPECSTAAWTLAGWSGNGMPVMGVRGEPKKVGLLTGDLSPPLQTTLETVHQINKVRWLKLKRLLFGARGPIQVTGPRGHFRSRAISPTIVYLSS